ncbi:MAG: hypothetical protein ACQER1_13625 [Armatimonadota bacterium]
MPGEGSERTGPRTIAGMSVGAAALVVLLAVVAAVGWSNVLHEQRLLGWHKSMIEASAAAPDQYRMLTPLLADTIFSFTAPDTVEQALLNLRHAYLAVHIVAFAVAGLFFVGFCRRWLSPSGSLLCCALLMAVASVSNLRGQIQVADPMNLMFVMIGLWAIQRRITWLLVAAIMLGAVNRESVLVLMGYFVLMEWPRPKRSVLLTAALLTIAWGVAYGAMRAGYGMRAYYVDVVMLEYNVAGFWRWAPPLLIMLPLLVAALKRPIKEWPGPLRRATLAIPPYLLLHLIIARVEEVRLFLPLLPILIPLAVLGVTGRPRGEQTPSPE